MANFCAALRVSFLRLNALNVERESLLTTPLRPAG